MHIAFLIINVILVIWFLLFYLRSRSYLLNPFYPRFPDIYTGSRLYISLTYISIISYLKQFVKLRYYSRWTSSILQEFRCWLSNPYNFQTFTLIVSNYVVVYMALRMFQQFNRFNVSLYFNPQVRLVTFILLVSLFPHWGHSHWLSSLIMISWSNPQHWQ